MKTCCPNRVARLARQAGIKAQIGYQRRLGTYGGEPSEMFYNPTRKHVRNGMLSPVNFERKQEMRTEGV